MDFIIALVITILLAIMTAQVAKKKGYKTFWFFMFGLFLPIIGLIYALAMKPGWYKTCPHCAENTKLEAKVCPHCGRDIT